MISICSINIINTKDNICLNDNFFPLMLYYNGDIDGLNNYLINNYEFQNYITSKVYTLKNYQHSSIYIEIYVDKDEIYTEKQVIITPSKIELTDVAFNYITYEIINNMYFTRFGKKLDNNKDVLTLEEICNKIIDESHNKININTIINYFRNELVENGFTSENIDYIICKLNNILLSSDNL